MSGEPRFSWAVRASLGVRSPRWPGNSSPNPTANLAGARRITHAHALLAATLFVALTTTLLIGTTLSVPAEAVKMRTWNKLAKCESGGRWHINTGNGYYGGLQISPRHLARLRRHASSRGPPHKATKRQQVRVAKRIKRHQGWGAWPHCSRRIGVRR